MTIELAMSLAAVVIAVGLVLATVVLAVTGQAAGFGTRIRFGLQPVLQALRDRSSLSRGQLADLSLAGAVVCSVLSMVLEQSILGAVTAIGFWVARPMVRRVTGEENPMAAVAGYFSIDLVIGIYAPLTVLQLLIGSKLVAAGFILVIVALSWPSGGGSSPVRRRSWAVSPVSGA